MSQKHLKMAVTAINKSVGTGKGCVEEAAFWSCPQLMSPYLAIVISHQCEEDVSWKGKLFALGGCFVDFY